MYPVFDEHYTDFKEKLAGKVLLNNADNQDMSKEKLSGASLSEKLST